MRKTFGFSIYDLAHFAFLLISDALTIGFCLWAGRALWVHSFFRAYQSPPSLQLLDLAVAVGIIVLTMIWRGTYRFHSSVLHVVKLKELISSVFTGFLLVVLIGFFTKSLVVSRLWALYSLLLLMPCMIFDRALVDKCWHECVARGMHKRRVLIYGAGFTGKRLIKSIRKLSKLNYEIVGFVDDNRQVGTEVTSNPSYVLGGFADIPRLAEEHGIDRLLLAMPNASIDAMKKVIAVCDNLKIKYKFVPGLHDIALHRVQMEIIDGIPLFSQKKLHFNRVNLFIKRSFDLLSASIGLVVLSPLMAWLYFAVKKDSPGPGIFRQRRVGKGGKEFDFFKFRSMYVEAPQYAVNPLDKGDPRVTKLGRFLRRTSLDELPQLWNVFIGEMSIVGPRPEMPFIVDTYNEMQRERLNVKPGITGLWQISADRALPIHENIDHDLYYIEHQSFLLDLVIIIETFFFALRGIGAH